MIMIIKTTMMMGDHNGGNDANATDKHYDKMC